MTIGEKHDKEKPRWDLLPFEELEEVVKVLTYGSQKYKDNNWKHVKQWRRRYFAAAMRHLNEWKKGNIIDEGSGENHLAHAISNIFFLLARSKEKRKKKK